MRIYVTSKDEQVCADCKHFVQYYVKWGVGFSPVFSGRCMFPRVKDREPYDTCQYFERKMPLPETTGGR